MGNMMGKITKNTALYVWCVDSIVTFAPLKDLELKIKIKFL
jgi:hypothetical protein